MVRKASVELKARWKKNLEDFLLSGSGISKFCQERKISKSSLYKWSKQLGIPISSQCSFTKAHQIDNSDAQTNPYGKEEAFSFIELNVSPSHACASFPLKLELLLAQECKLKIETTSTWDQVVGMIKTLVN